MGYSKNFGSRRRYKTLISNPKEKVLTPALFLWYNIIKEREKKEFVVTVYIAHFIKNNFQEKEVVTKPYPDLNILMSLCKFVAQTFPNIGFWIEEKEI